MLREFQMRHQFSVAEQARACAGSQRQDKFESFAADDGKPLHFRIIDHLCGTPEPIGRRVGQREARPFLCLEMWSGQDAIVSHDPGKADGNTVVPGQWRDEIFENIQQYGRRAKAWRLYAMPRHEQPAR
ncbi:MAG TPA: hypothetical protein VHU23_06195 [Rhizomicrobium sp.]|nr:hypothetical protein [Rhizomicrobium sp.]